MVEFLLCLLCGVFSLVSGMCGIFMLRLMWLSNGLEMCVW